MEEKLEKTNLVEQNNKPKNWLRNYFTTYEKLWFVFIIVASVALAIIFPEEDVNNVSGLTITILYLLDVVIAAFCELLTSKQSRWSFLIYNVVEVIEIVTLILIRARFASMAVAIFFWIPIHTVSFINWTRHKDEQKKELTIVRSLKWWQSLLMLLGIAIWTVIIGYVIAAYGPETDFYSSESVARAVAYMDACLSAVSIADGVTIFFRVKETWLVWYIYIILETIVNIITGQWILLVLKVGYITNTTYGYIKWTKYINNRQKFVIERKEKKI